MYTPTGTFDRDDVVKRHSSLVRRLAHQMIARLPGSVDVDDLVQAGMMGLLDAASRFEDSHGAQFETYAAQRIRGSMLDSLRQHDWMPRGVRRAQRRIDEAVRQAEQRVGHAPGEREIAETLGVSLEDYHQLLQDARGAQLVFYEDLGEEGADVIESVRDQSANDPLARIEDRRMREALVEAIEMLPEREKTVMGLYYERELTLREIAEVLGVTESRVCQLHGQAIARLRTRMREREPA